MTEVWIVWQFDRTADDFVPVGIFSKAEDAEQFKLTLSGSVAAIQYPMAQAMDKLVLARLAGLGLKLEIVETA